MTVQAEGQSDQGKHLRVARRLRGQQTESFTFKEEEVQPREEVSSSRDVPPQQG